MTLFFVFLLKKPLICIVLPAISMKKQIELANNLKAIPKLAVFVEEVCEELALEKRQFFKLNLVLEEAVTNVILYAYPHNEDHTFQVFISKENGVLTTQVKDAGIPFDPTTQAPEVNTTLNADERKIGGLGIFLIKEYMDTVSYQRTADGYNVLTMTKKIS